VEGDLSRREKVLQDLKQSNRFDARVGDIVEIIISEMRAWRTLKNKVGVPGTGSTSETEEPDSFPIHNTQNEKRLTRGNQFTVREVATHISGQQTFIAVRVDLNE